ncbi:glyoxylase-like metal-dependent hydrolase (beta-lactamase superfamily II) [Saccharothrix tamanrassetensis]|uniref:Glyoxylase-like metal-dependent hydrolase (Beta-lactamase superfamily II) n=1 Tax=Saccharothrix tamanrassetensis TaxID=1051531 RepID=A0A841CX00_9PSEU|nr:MBL fold metallo-hydrolase [Saccharothrix tamanrassetensis]MBB5960465.1 glyoxylase-like metal-dependent hydrolase (beta-lactamase superfamily II) [Saccharothrix tamanrassetensis]
MTSQAALTSPIPASAPLRTDQPHQEASARTPVPPGVKITRLFEENMEKPFVLQRLTERTWWVSVKNYTTVFVVGSDSVLLFDAPLGRTSAFREAIASVTEKHVSTLVYSHFHTDHIDDVQHWIDAASEDGINLRLIASARTAAKLEAARSILPRPTETVAWPSSSFTFEGIEVRLHGFEWAAHTEDHGAWLLPTERVAHVPDLISPDQPPFWRFAANERFLFTEDNLRAVNELEWDYLSGGHGNIGDHGDIEAELEFIADLRGVVAEKLARRPLESYVDATLGSHTTWFTQFLEETGREVADRLRTKYGHMYGYEAAAAANGEMVALHMVQYH